MHDMTQGNITGHLIRMSLPILIGMVVQTLYLLVDLYFVAGLGEHALAGVSAAGTVTFLVMALTQVLSVGTVSLISQALGRKDREAAQSAFAQSLWLSAVTGAVVLLMCSVGAPQFLALLSDDPQSQAEGVRYLQAFAPGLALQFALVSVGAALRAAGIVNLTMAVQMLSVVVNALLAPVLIAGWITGVSLGVAGAGWASTIGVLVAVVVLLWRFVRSERFLSLRVPALRWHGTTAKELLKIGTPAGGEFACWFVYMGILFVLISPFGAVAQAGVGVAQRLVQAIWLPGVAVSFAVPAIAGQNVGAGLVPRVRETLWRAVQIEVALMLVLTAVTWWSAPALSAAFSPDAGVQQVSTEFLQIIVWNFCAAGVVFACSGLFQALGNTLPSLFSMGMRLLMFAIPGFWLAQQAGFTLTQLWWTAVCASTVQAATSVWLARRQLHRFQMRVQAA